MHTQKSNKGFTLVELIVVITILLILSVLATSAFSGVMGQAREASHRADAAALVRQINMFNSLADHNSTSSIRTHADLAALLTGQSGDNRTFNMQLLASGGTLANGVHTPAGINMAFTVTMSYETWRSIRQADRLAGSSIHLHAPGAGTGSWSVATAAGGADNP